MTILKEKGKESIKHMWQRKRNLKKALAEIEGYVL
jgi:hypothetical protein